MFIMQRNTILYCQMGHQPPVLSVTLSGIIWIVSFENLVIYNTTHILIVNFYSYKLQILWDLSATLCLQLCVCTCLCPSDKTDRERERLTICPEPRQQHTPLSGSIRRNEKAPLQGRDSLCVCVCVFYVSR